MSSAITKSSKKKDKRQVSGTIFNLEREYRDCIKSRGDKIGITRHIMMHQVLYIVQLPNEEGDMNITSNVFELESEYRDGKGDKIMTACTHSRVIEDARNSQPQRINATSPILSQRHTAESRIDVYYTYMKYTTFMLCGG